MSHEISKEAYDDSREIDEILDNVEKGLFNMTRDRLKGGFTHIDPVLQETFEKLDYLSSKKGTVIGVPSGLIDLDEITSGFQDSDLIIIAGRPGMGKTALALTLIRNASIENNVGVGMFS